MGQKFNVVITVVGLLASITTILVGIYTVMTWNRHATTWAAAAQGQPSAPRQTPKEQPKSSRFGIGSIGSAAGRALTLQHHKPEKPQSTVAK